MVWFSLALTRCLHRIQNFSFCHLVTVQSPNGAWLFVTPMDCSMPGFSVLDYFHRVGSNSCPLGQGCYSTISSSVTPFSYCPQSFPASGSFPKAGVDSHSLPQGIFPTQGSNPGFQMASISLPSESPGKDLYSPSLCQILTLASWGC